MTVRPHPTVRGAFAVVVMAVLLLAASSLFSAAAPHHRGGAPTAVASADQQHGAAVVAEDEHQHGNDWTPRLNQRARSVTVAAVPYHRGEVDLLIPASAVPGVVLSRLGVLRV
ncbi:hypothetical protein Q0Z83_015500 [Actinoplanes sichuanensis]|uniref:Uncharacterized protein n=1 Tax=Actinoplanes sichuanensis TaxID=512349 RepID=A0ABW4A8H1_9ACTN|nr:hypothetical protein [Actinoplanes sichuanensis]BEL03359.1 hypothetical protein Q0Z83_015500 [Actinoplanes sichuanensis]